ncbi:MULTISPECIES: hypothetical protein [unclassified Psychrobacter]|uniref:hypothetical protein n=1 Tax=unclassified Psychrobacter TaxID=196806 RepID=UPI0025B4AECE|nr:MULTISPECIES: hypothetical protein [unclassified Psychrobacter]MDN3453961.1 hypothetical protein [Psychrobacter sp. APC 3350]MDN3503169.1 hypothetical protein [Psychrobacter sp. 5A.1]
MTLPTALIATACLLSGALTGCSTDRFSQSNDNASAMAGESGIGDKIKNIISRDNDDLQDLKGQLEKQQQQLETMLAEQQALQQQLKRQQIVLTIKPSANANAGRATQGTASTAYVAFLEEESEFADIEALAAKEVSVVPNRESTLTLNIPQDARFMAVKVGLRYTKKRSQFLIPITSLNFDTPLTLNIGACDVSVVAGINPEQAPTFTTKLKYYQQPLASCS